LPISWQSLWTKLHLHVCGVSLVWFFLFEFWLGRSHVHMHLASSLYHRLHLYHMLERWASPIYFVRHDVLYMILWASLVCYGYVGLALDDLDLCPWLLDMLLKMLHECSLVGQCLYMILTCFCGFAMLNLWLDSLFWSYGAKGSFVIMDV
jgi:hypothetical protein